MTIYQINTSAERCFLPRALKVDDSGMQVSCDLKIE